MAQGGATAVEFAIVAVPFLLILFAVLETGMFFVVSVSLESKEIARRGAVPMRTA